MEHKGVNLLDDGRFFDYNTPMKYGSIRHLHLNWLEYNVLFILKGKEREIEFAANLNSVEKMYLEVSGSPRQYLDNTHVFLLKCKEVSESKINILK